MKAYTGAHGYAFMSYSHKDEEKIKPLIEKLQSVGCNIWYDEGILPADEWAETIAKKLAGASLFFLILSENAAASQNVKREIYYAVSHDLPILTFYLENVNLSQGLEMQLGISQAVHTQHNTENDYAIIKSLFPKEAVGGVEPQIIYSTRRFHYAFLHIKDTKLEFKMGHGADGHLYGSVTSKDIAEALKSELGVEIDKRKITLKESIRAYGAHDVEIKLYTDVIAKFIVHVHE